VGNLQQGRSLPNPSGDPPTNLETDFIV